MGSEDWLTIGALAVALSFVLSAAANRSERLADTYARILPPDPPPERLHDDCRPVDFGDARALVLGMGRVGKSAARQLVKEHGVSVLGLEQDKGRISALAAKGWRVLEADASDLRLWESLRGSHVEMVIVALPSHETSMDILRLLQGTGFEGTVAAMARYPDHVGQLTDAGADVVLQVYEGAGAQLADEAVAGLPTPSP